MTRINQSLKYAKNGGAAIWGNGVRFEFSKKLRAAIDRRMNQPIRVDTKVPKGTRKMAFSPTIWRLGGKVAYFDGDSSCSEKEVEKQIKKYMDPINPQHPLLEKAAAIGVYPGKHYYLLRSSYADDPIQKNLAVASMLEFEANYYQMAAKIEIPKVLAMRFTQKKMENGEITRMDIRKLFGTAGRICLTEERDRFLRETPTGKLRIQRVRHNRG